MDKEDSLEFSMEFLRINSALQSAFQAGQQFLVISWNKPVTVGEQDYILYGTDGNSCNFVNEIIIEGWPFLANVPTSDPKGVFSNVLIFKFCDGTVVDCFKDSDVWTKPELFNNVESGNLELLENWLASYCAAAADKSEIGDSSYTYFSTIMNDPAWKGILLLQSDINLQSFPNELQNLPAGIDLSRFSGHHLGISVNSTPVVANDSLTISAKNPLFGLIDYTDVVFDQYQDDIREYLASVSKLKNNTYKVLSLRVLFGNSVVESFNCYVQSVLNHSDIIISKGIRDNQNGNPQYIFSNI